MKHEAYTPGLIGGDVGFHKNCACQWKEEIDNVLLHVKQLFVELLFQLSLLTDFVSLFVS